MEMVVHLCESSHVFAGNSVSRRIFRSFRKDIRHDSEGKMEPHVVEGSEDAAAAATACCVHIRSARVGSRTHLLRVENENSGLRSILVVVECNANCLL